MNSTDSDWVLGRLVDSLVDAVVEQNQAVTYTQSRLSAFITYCYSWYGFACMAMAIVLNRTMVIASTNTSRAQQAAFNRRRNSLHAVRSSEVLKDSSLVLFRVSIIGVLCYNAYHVLVALNVNAMLAGKVGGVFGWMQRSGLFEYDPDHYNLYKYMKTPKKSVALGPSTDMYWPIFMGFCMSTYIETFTAAIQGKKAFTEAGFTLFEHSLAFQEESSDGKFFLGMSKVAHPSDQLLVACLFSIANHLTFQIGALVNNNRYRLIPSSIIGTSFLVYFTRVLLSGNSTKFPLVVILSTLPQIVMLGIIVVSFLIFVMAVFGTGFKFQDLNYASFFTHGNSENDPEFQERTLFKLSDDFFSSLLNLASMALTSAGKSSYITELSIVAADNETWIERSIWERFLGKFSVTNADATRSINTAGFISFLRENKINGYANLITDPSTRLVAGRDPDSANETLGSAKPSIMKSRILNTKDAVVDLLQLVKGVFFDKLIVANVKWYILGRRDPIFDEYSYEAFEQRRNKVPPFLRKFVQQKREPVNTEEKLIELDDVTDDELEVNYLTLLKEGEISEIDHSADYVDFTDDESIVESDVESIANDHEFMAVEQFTELIDAENIDVLQQHFKHDSIMTRSRYSAIVKQHDDHKNEATKLIEVILSKRRGHLDSLLQGLNPQGGDEFDNNSLDCVICQVNTREIITWPCKCFSICESCRLTLASKGLEGCVCCRRDVEGVSRVFIP